MRPIKWGWIAGRATVNVVVLATMASAVGGTLAYRAVSTAKTPVPSVSISFPANNGTYSASTWNAGCAVAGLCGSAADSAGISRVSLTLRQNSSGLYWNGSSLAAGPTTLAATLSSPGATAVTWSYALAARSFPDGTYTLVANATDRLGTTTTSTQAAQSVFTVLTTAPPAPAFTANGTPDDPTFATNATFTYTDAQAGVSFRCYLDQGPYAGCGSNAQNYYNLAIGTHTFSLIACDAAGNCSTALSFSWTIIVRKSFPVSGAAVSNFYPGGAAVPINLVIGNPYNFTLEVTAVTVTVNGTSASGCDASNFTVVQNLAAPVDIPAGQTLSLQAAGVPQSSWPQVQMIDTHVSQDACKGATVSFSFAGQGTKAP
jgi:hypothetical protein